MELIQDFTFPVSSNLVQVAADGQTVIVSGTYPPCYKVFQIDQLALKVERRVDAQLVQMELLAEDDSKIVLLREDRTVEFHVKAGCHYKARLPRVCRDMKYYDQTCDLYLGGAAPVVYRLNLDQGRMLEPIETEMVALTCFSFSI